MAQPSGSARPALVENLRAALGPGAVLTGADVAPYLSDLRGEYRGDAVAVVRPADTAEVADTVRLCSEHGVAVVSQGGNTGLSGGSIPGTGRPSIVLGLGRMNRIVSVDPDRDAITAEAGCTIQAVQEAAAAVDRSFPPDWGARGTATVGGAIATNAGGINVLQYGSMRPHVLGIEAVLADGRIWNGLRSLRKDATGYDLKQLFIGAEGTLGVVTQAVLALHPAVREGVTALASLPDLEGLMRLLALARRHARGALTAFELIPELGVRLVTERYGRITRPTTAPAEWYLLVRFSSAASDDDVRERLTSYLALAAGEGLIADAVVASTAEQEENLWNLRDELSPMGLFEHLDQAVKLDTAVPIDRIERYHAGIVELVAQLVPGAQIYAFGHVGDGNLHIYVLPPPGNPDALALQRAAVERRIDALTLDLGGTLSAEHGIGQALLDRMAVQKSPVELELMRAIKEALDPHDLLNPGKLIPTRTSP